MALASSSTTAAESPDMTLIGELYEDIDRNPPGLEARRILMQQYLLFGWFDAANDAAKELLRFDPANDEAIACTMAWADHKTQPVQRDLNTVPTYKPVGPSDIGDLDSAKRDLAEGCKALRDRAKRLQQELRLLQNLQFSNGTGFCYDKHTQHLAALAEGRICLTVRVQKPGSARSVARSMETMPQQAVDTAIADLTTMASWLRSRAGEPTTAISDSPGQSLAERVLGLASNIPGMAQWLVSEPCQNKAPENDVVREALVKRVGALRAALPESLQRHASTALMHVEHEVLGRKYVNDETMLGDPICDIPRLNFFVSEDGMCWDMAELAQAITSGGGVMRNPMSKQMFTADDVRAIVQHPFGKALAALQIEQSKLSKGFRPKTIARLDELSKILLVDMSSDGMASRQAVDEFLGYVATLPQTEQQAIDKLRVPAKDSHTNQAFDTTIGDSVRDAKANLVCFHKTGDFIGQAAAHLRKK